MPDASGLDILDDVENFYSWLATPDNLAGHLPDGIIPDVGNVLVTGESAGGWLALQSALLSEPRRSISAVIAQYPMIDMRAPWYTGDFEKQIFTPVAPQLDRSILEKYMTELRDESTVTSAVPPDRVPLVISALQQGKFGELLGDNSSLYPLELLDNVTDLPTTWILHGTGDTVIPVEGTYNFEKKLKEKLPQAKAHFTYESGDHGFDNAPDVSIGTPWIREGVEYIKQSWPHH